MSTDNELIVRRVANVDSLEKELEELKKAAMSGQTSAPPQEPVYEEATGEVQEVEDPKGQEAPENKEEETFKKRYGDLRRHSQKVEKELRDQIKELREKLDNPPSMPTTPEQVKAWVERFPEVAAIVNALAEEQVTKQNAQIKETLQEIALEKERAKIREKHPDYDTIVKDDDFHDWADEQPAVVRDAIYDGSSTDVIWALTRYKKDRNIKSVDPVKEAAMLTSKRGSAPEPKAETKSKYSESLINSMSNVEYEKIKDKVHEAIRNGTFIYDMTGAAR